jgi:hypothetical protein
MILRKEEAPRIRRRWDSKSSCIKAPALLQRAHRATRQLFDAGVWISAAAISNEERAEAGASRKHAAVEVRLVHEAKVDDADHHVKVF